MVQLRDRRLTASSCSDSLNGATTMDQGASALICSARNCRWPSFQYGESATFTSPGNWCLLMNSAMAPSLASSPNCRSRLVILTTALFIEHSIATEMDPTPPSGETVCPSSTVEMRGVIMEIAILGIDLAKRVFQLHGADRRGQAMHRSKVSRPVLMETIRQLRSRTIAMEACSSAHDWARQFQALGIEVQLISPHYVKPFVKTNKNDRNDAEAIVEAACRPSMNFVPVKSVEQQDIQAVHRVRELLVHQRTALINQARGLLAERGIIIAKSPAAFKRSIPDILSEPDGS